MAITKTTTPYEFLVRWNNGALSGAHVRFLETISEDGVVLTQKEGNAMPVSMAGEAGYPLADVLTAVQQTALADLAAAQATASSATAAIATKDATIASLQAQIDAFTPPAPTTTVTARQIRLALSQAGLRTQVEAAVAAGNQSTKDWYEYANEFERTNPLVIGMAAALGVSDESLDDLFALAATL